MNKSAGLAPNLRTNTLIAIISAIVLIAATAPIVSAQSPTSMMVSPQAINVEKGETFAVNVLIDTDIPAGAAQCAITYDPHILQCDEYTEGSFFKEWAAGKGYSTMMLPTGSIDNSSGIVNTTGVFIAGLSGNPSEGVTGEGVFLSYTFTALSNGVSPIELENRLSVIRDPSSEAINLEARLINGKVTVGTVEATPTTTSKPLTTTSAPNETDTNGDTATTEDDDDSNAGMIIGIVIAFLLLAVIVFLFLRKKGTTS